ncbi:hypothetical protein V8E54_001832 [Elaphomyces granulatus]
MSLSIELLATFLFSKSSSLSPAELLEFALESLGNAFGEVEHLLCQWHCKQTLNQQLHGDIPTLANQHLQTAQWSRRTESGCDKFIQAALDSIPDTNLL